MFATSEKVLGMETVPVSKIYFPSVLIEFTVNGGKREKYINDLGSKTIF